MEDQESGFTHYAILIGIDAYPEQPLKSCVRDVKDIEKYLKRMPHLVDIQMLTATEDLDGSRPIEDSKMWPTYDNVASSLEQITSSAKAGSFVYLHFSGHGTTRQPLKDTSNVSIGGATLVPAECSNPSTGDLALVLLEAANEISIRYLRGEELASLIKMMVDNGLIVTLVLDCCFSGSVMRNDSSVRCLQYDPDIDAAYSPASGLKPENSTGRTVYRDVCMRSNWLVDPDGYTVLTACGPTEITKEIIVNEQKRGPLSYLLLETLEELGDMGRKQRYIYPHLCYKFRQAQERNPDKPIRNPMLYGNKNLGFFGRTTSGINASPIPVIEKRDGGLQLEAGEAHGICDGDEFAIYPSSAARTDFEPRGDFVIAKATHVRALASDLEISKSTSANTEIGWMAIILTRLSLRKCPVQLELSVPYPEEWARVLQDRPSLDIYNTDRMKPGFSFSFYVAIFGSSSYEIRDESNERILNLPTPFDDPGKSVSNILDMVEHLAMFKMVRSLANNSLAEEAYSFNNSFDVKLINSAGRAFDPGCFEQCDHPGCLVEAIPGEKLELVVQNKGNIGGDPLHIHIFNMGPKWEIENILSGNHEILPPRYSNQHEDFRQGTSGEWRQELEMQVPLRMNRNGYLHYEDIIKIFLTTQSTSFMSLELPEIGTNLERNGNDRTRGESGGPRSDNWAALNFRIRSEFK